MHAEISIRRFSADEWPTYRALRLAALEESPDSFGSTLEREKPQSDTAWESRLAQGVSSAAELPLCALVDGRPIGLTWGRIDDANPQIAQMFQMWVAPPHRRQGVARKLVDAVIAWAQDRCAESLHLTVTIDHAPAVRLYVAVGFREDGPPEPIRPGSRVLAQPMSLELRRS
jgi:GNAT superfamily N-acetyltransferase